MLGKTRQIIILQIAVILAARLVALGAPAPPMVTAESAILVDATSGRVLYEKRCHTRRPPASTTKIMTAIVILENSRLDDIARASQYACKTQYGSLHLQPGETLRLRDLLRAILIRSANDAAVCAAEHIAGSEQKFVDMMNKKAQEIGCHDTHFVNPHGLHDPRHYSTAYDLALMARYATRFPEFNEIVRMPHATISRSVNTRDIALRNTARFLSRYKGADGIKTGYTREAGRCFVGSATRGKWRVISVVLKSKDAERDTCALLDYAFKYFKCVSFARIGEVAATVPVIGGTERRLDLIPTESLGQVIPKSASVQTKTVIDVKKVAAPVHKGQKVGTLTGWINGKKLGTVDLVAANSIERTLSATIWMYTKTLFTLMGLVIIGFVSYGTAFAKIARRRRRRFASGSRKINNIGAGSS